MKEAIELKEFDEGVVDDLVTKTEGLLSSSFTSSTQELRDALRFLRDVQNLTGALKVAAFEALASLSTLDSEKAVLFESFGNATNAIKSIHNVSVWFLMRLLDRPVDY